MCYRPVKIRNTRINFRQGIDKEYLYVPCNHCAECRQRAVNEWYVRLSYEADYYRSVGGAVYFVTFTFNNDSVPTFDFTPYQDVFKRYNVSQFDFNQFNGQYVFDKLQVLSFLKHLRQIFRDDYNVINLKYFIVTELGTDNNHTHRSHYHALIFCPISFDDDNKFLGICNYCWSDRIKIKDYPQFKVNDIDLQKQFCRGYYYQDNNVIVRESNGCAGVTYHRRRGFCSWSKHPVTHLFRPRLVNNLGIKYLLKYLHKDDLYMSNTFARDVQEQLKLIPAINVFEEKLDLLDSSQKQDYELVIEGIKYLKNCLPFHVQSSKLGQYLLNQYNKVFDYNDMVQNNKISVRGDKQKYFIPQYVLRRLMYDEDYSQERFAMGANPRSVQLNERGYKVMKEMYDIRLEQKLDNYRYYLSDKFISRFHDLPYSKWCDIDISNLRRILSNNLDLLPVYDIIYRGVPCFVKNSDKLTSTQLLLLAKSIYNYKLDTNGLFKRCDFNSMMEVTAFPNFNVINAEYVNSCQYFNDLDIFIDCEYFLQKIDYIKKSVLSPYYEQKDKERKGTIITTKVNHSLLYNSK